MKILYLQASSKNVELSTSKQVGNELLKYLIKNIDEDVTVQTIDMYNYYIPLPKASYFTSRASLVKDKDFENLNEEEKNDVRIMEELCDMFLEADIILLAYPMWSLSFPSIVKRYLDCIILNNKLIEIDNDKVTGLLKDKKRVFICVQSSGADYPVLLSKFLNHGISYLKEVFLFLGIDKFIPILVEGTEQNNIGKEEAIEKARDEFSSTLKKIKDIF